MVAYDIGFSGVDCVEGVALPSGVGFGVGGDGDCITVVFVEFVTQFVVVFTAVVDSGVAVVVSNDVVVSPSGAAVCAVVGRPVVDELVVVMLFASVVSLVNRSFGSGGFGDGVGDTIMVYNNFLLSN